MIENRSIAKENNELAAQLRMRAPEQKTMSKLSHQDRWWAVEPVCVLGGPVCVCLARSGAAQLYTRAREVYNPVASRTKSWIMK